MSEKYEGPHVGSKVAVQVGDKVIEDTISSVSYTSPEPAIYRDMRWWETLLRHHRLRRVVPARLRQPIKPIRPCKPSTMTVTVGSGVNTDALARHQKSLEDIQRMLGGFTR